VYIHKNNEYIQVYTPEKRKKDKKINRVMYKSLSFWFQKEFSYFVLNIDIKLI